MVIADGRNLALKNIAGVAEFFLSFFGAVSALG